LFICRFNNLYETGIYQHQQHIYDAIARIQYKNQVKEIIENNTFGARDAIEAIKFSETDATSFTSIRGLLFLTYSLLIFALFVFLIELCINRFIHG